MTKTEAFKQKGFDLTINIPFTSQFRIRCSQCEALVINDTPTHELRCPNIPRDEDDI